MLFNSYEFLFFFLPVTAAVFFLFGRLSLHRAAMAWLVLASLFFYAWWEPAYLLLIAASIVFNYGIGSVLANMPSRALLAVGVSGNLAGLAYFKYANFFVDNLNDFGQLSLSLPEIALPLAISFFTFQQIAFLVDAWRGETREYRFLNYCLFVCFFPQLIAGPIVHHKEMLPQFEKRQVFSPQAQCLAVGISFIILGLFKKLVIADNLAFYANPVFDAADSGIDIGFFEAWGAALAYTLQLYFDFSGYVDMAMGAARIFGIRLPINFDSPYKSLSIIEFWRRWHITLSRFLRDYLYISLGGNRHGRTRRYLNLMITMTLGGLWHGAGWTFVFWGVLHGSYLIINHAWRALCGRLGLRAGQRYQSLGRLSAWGLTFCAVVFSWVFFRATTFDGAVEISTAMLGQGLHSLPDSLAGRLGGLEAVLAEHGVFFDRQTVLALNQWAGGMPVLLAGLLIALFMPNSNEMLDQQPRTQWLRWQLNPATAVAASAMFAVAMLNMSTLSPFLYFNF